MFLSAAGVFTHSPTSHCTLSVQANSKMGVLRLFTPGSVTMAIMEKQTCKKVIVSELNSPLEILFRGRVHQNSYQVIESPSVPSPTPDVVLKLHLLSHFAISQSSPGTGSVSQTWSNGLYNQDEFPSNLSCCLSWFTTPGAKSTDEPFCYVLLIEQGVCGCVCNRLLKCFSFIWWVCQKNHSISIDVYQNPSAWKKIMSVEFTSRWKITVMTLLVVPVWATSIQCTSVSIKLTILLPECSIHLQMKNKSEKSERK